MGKPQPLKTFEQKAPSFEPSTSNAIRIQRVVFPDKQQFIKTSCVQPQGICKSIFASYFACGFLFLLHNIPFSNLLCENACEKIRKNGKTPSILLIKSKKCVIILVCAWGIRLRRFYRRKKRKYNFFLRVSQRRTRWRFLWRKKRSFFPQDA